LLRSAAPVPVAVVADYVVGDAPENAPGPAVRAPSAPSVLGNTEKLAAVGQPGHFEPG